MNCLARTNCDAWLLEQKHDRARNLKADQLDAILDIIDLLLAAGARVNGVTDSQGQPLLQQTVSGESGQTSAADVKRAAVIAHKLLRAGADPEAVNTTTGQVRAPACYLCAIVCGFLPIEVCSDLPSPAMLISRVAVFSDRSHGLLQLVDPCCRLHRRSAPVLQDERQPTRPPQSDCADARCHTAHAGSGVLVKVRCGDRL